MRRISFDVLYNAVRAINAWYPLGALGVFLIAFFLAMALMFVFPQGTILLMFMGLAGLGIAVLGAKVLSSVQHSLARHSMRKGVCPVCKSSLGMPGNVGHEWRCEHCGVTLSETGAEVQAQAVDSRESDPRPK